MSTPGYLKKLRGLSQSDPTFEHLLPLDDELYGASGRVTAIMFASFLEESLRKLLESVIRKDLSADDKNKLFGFDRSLGSFSSRITMSYALSLIGPNSRKDLDLIREIRNVFAHSRLPLEFETPEIKVACNALTTPDLPKTMLPIAYLHRLERDEGTNDHPRTRFISTCYNLSYRIMLKRDGPKAGDHVIDDPLP